MISHIVEQKPWHLRNPEFEMKKITIKKAFGLSIHRNKVNSNYFLIEIVKKDLQGLVSFLYLKLI